VRQRRATIKDVAAVARVSISTVSNVLNNRGHAMSAETLERIQSAMRDLDYRPSSLARGLPTRHTATIGVVVADIETPLFLKALTLIEPAARRAGYTVLIINARDTEEEREAVDVLVQKEVNAAIFLSTSVYAPTSHLLPLRAAERSVVLVNRPPDEEEFDTVNWDNAGAIDGLVAHLVALGHRHIALLRGPSNRRSAAERLAGYRRALQAHGLPYRDEYTPSGDYTLSREVWQRSTLDLLALDSPPTALIASDDDVAAAVIQDVQRTGRCVPDDLAIVGVDDQPFGMYLRPPLTTARLPVAEAGRQAITMTLERLGGQRKTPSHLLLPCTLIIRESCGGTPHEGSA